MIDTRVRPRIQGFLGPIGKFLAGIGVTPTVMTAVGLAVAIVGAVIIGTGRLALGATIALIGSALDGLDGTVARASGSVTARGAFLDAGSDRIGEIAAFAGLAVAKEGNARVLVLIVLSVGGAMLVPYLRAKAEAVGLPTKNGLMGRAERVILFFLGLVTGFVEPMLWVMVVSVWITAIQRFVSTYRRIET
ncbi:MAG TPA: CDP-alcohol phosphatidyltransferase family protein [Acidimicrobiia bacterium]|nr:CDP-alcohol phosphatidyltransferase family protein [Acidimicrobiia bacterium]